MKIQSPGERDRGRVGRQTQSVRVGHSTKSRRKQTEYSGITDHKENSYGTDLIRDNGDKSGLSVPSQIIDRIRAAVNLRNVKPHKWHTRMVKLFTNREVVRRFELGCFSVENLYKSEWVISRVLGIQRWTVRQRLLFQLCHARSDEILDGRLTADDIHRIHSDLVKREPTQSVGTGRPRR